ncbi:MAG: FAD-dependent oxidoreductase [Burkholderiales bacterium]|nr:FAD-dependent oxidoreductase [Burkholderiales bacterium]
MRYSVFSLARQALSRHRHWPLAWRSPAPKKHYDAVIVGGGIAGLAAARAAASAGARVVVCDENPHWGGETPGDDPQIDGIDAVSWISATALELAQSADVTLLPRTTAFGVYDGMLVGAVERVADHLPEPAPHAPRQRLWKIRAKAVVLASGAHERSIAYGNNDLPGTLLAGAARTYVRRYGVGPGRRAVVFANHDGAYADALALHAAGIVVAAVIDVRANAQLQQGLPARVRAAGVSIHAGSMVVRAHGRRHVAAVDVVQQSGGAPQRIDCDLVCVSGGWNPAVHLFSQARGSLRFDESLAAFVPASSPMPIYPAGAANGRFDLADALADGHAAGARAAANGGADPAVTTSAPRASVQSVAPLQPLWAVATDTRGAKRFVDLQNDVTADDVALAAREGYQAVEHLKRYTTLGMGTDQGKTSNVIGLALMAEQLGVAIPRVGTTTFRPPYTPVTLGAFPGADCSPQVAPTRRSAMHAWHAAHGARFVNAGLWKRPHSYPRDGESEDDAAMREARSIALALLERGRARHGEELWAVSPLAGARVRVRIGPPCFIDPEGERLRV